MTPKCTMTVFSSAGPIIRIGPCEKMPCGHDLTSLSYACRECKDGLDRDAERTGKAVLRLSEFLQKEYGIASPGKGWCDTAIRLLKKAKAKP